MKKIWLKIRLFLFYLFNGMKNANDIAFTGNQDTDGGNGSSIEQQKEVQSVYKDMLRGELTEEVKELRHEMYFAERASKKYVYAGNGRAVRLNNIMAYNGSLEMSDGLDVLLVQDNTENIGTLLDYEIYNIGDKVELGEKAKGDLNNVLSRKFTININRDFIPKFKLENYTTKIVVKPLNDKQSILDLYVSSYVKQFDNVHKLFIKQIENIYCGDIKNDILNFNELDFITYNAFGVDDLLNYTFNNIVFENIIKHDGSYVLRFIADNILFGKDLLEEMYHEQTAIKNKEHTPRKNTTITSELFIQELNRDNKKIEEEIKLLGELYD